jgi:DNA invertase Pin-like site-specific DNA recombinase
VALYVRVSLDRKGRQKSINEQETELRGTARDEGWQVVQVFADNDRSASRYATKERPGYRALLDFLGSNSADVVATWENSRLTRDLGEFNELAKVCERTGTRWHYGGFTYDLTKASDRRRVGHDMVDSSAESDLTRERVLRSVRAAAVAGLPHGRRLYGYRRVYDELTGALDHVEVNDEQADVLREAAAHVLAGGSLYRLAHDLDRRGVPTMTANARKWHASNLTRALKSPGYAGKRVLRGEVVGDAVWPPIFDEVTWTRLQVVLRDPARNTRPETATSHLLSGLMSCGHCGEKAFYVLTAARSRGGRKSYTCRSCQKVSRLQEPVDALVTATVRRLLSEPSWRAVWDRASAPDDSALAEAMNALAAIEARLEAFYASAADGEISPRALASIETRVSAEIEELRGLIRSLSTRSTVLDELTPTEIVQRWERLPIDTQRRVIRELFVIELLPVGRGKRVFDPAYVVIKPTWN